MPGAAATRCSPDVGVRVLRARAEHVQLLLVAHELQARRADRRRPAGPVELLNGEDGADDVAEGPPDVAVEFEDEAEDALALLRLLGFGGRLEDVLARNGLLRAPQALLRRELERSEVVSVRRLLVGAQRCEAAAGSGGVMRCGVRARWLAGSASGARGA